MASIPHWLRTFGLDPKRTRTAVAGLARYVQDRWRFRRELGTDFEWGDELPILDEWSASSGELGAYFHQDLQFAKWIHDDNPHRHIDVGSRIDGFIAHLAVFRQVEVIDIRPQPERIPNVDFHQLDLMEELPPDWINCTDSLSCLHTIEHFGLGRYGDPLDPDGHLRGLDQLKAMVRPGGRLYLSTPMGPQRVEFNAHRIFAASTLLKWFESGWSIERFAFLDDRQQLHIPTELDLTAVSDNFGCRTGLAMLVARKQELP